MFQFVGVLLEKLYQKFGEEVVVFTILGVFLAIFLVGKYLV